MALKGMRDDYHLVPRPTIQKGLPAMGALFRFCYPGLPLVPLPPHVIPATTDGEKDDDPYPGITHQVKESGRTFGFLHHGPSVDGTNYRVFGTPVKLRRELAARTAWICGDCFAVRACEMAFWVCLNGPCSFGKPEVRLIARGVCVEPDVTAVALRSALVVCFDMGFLEVVVRA